MLIVVATGEAVPNITCKNGVRDHFKQKNGVREAIPCGRNGGEMVSGEIVDVMPQSLPKYCKRASPLQVIDNRIQLQAGRSDLLATSVAPDDRTKHVPLTVCASD